MVFAGRPVVTPLTDYLKHRGKVDLGLSLLDVRATAWQLLAYSVKVTSTENAGASGKLGLMVIIGRKRRFHYCVQVPKIVEIFHERSLGNLGRELQSCHVMRNTDC